MEVRCFGCNVVSYVPQLFAKQELRNEPHMVLSRKKTWTGHQKKKNTEDVIHIGVYQRTFLVKKRAKQFGGLVGE